MSFEIRGRPVGGSAPTLIVAEVAQAHDGSLGTAHAFVDAVAAAGADVVKFQTHIAAAESTRDEPFRVRFSEQDETRFDYWRRMEFSEEQWGALARHAEEAGLLFMSSPFSVQAVELLERVGAPAFKVGSGEVANPELLDRMAATGLPVILSSGLSGWEELDAAVSRVREAGAPAAVLQCTTAYPSQPEDTGLNLLSEMRERYDCPVGLSDHSGTIYPSLAAVALGASIVEVHVTLSREAFGPDVPASVTADELRELVQGVRFIERALANPVDKDASSAALAETKQLFGRSLAPARDLPAGTLLDPADLASKKPGGGISPERLQEIVGRRLSRDVRADELLQESDLE